MNTLISKSENYWLILKNLSDDVKLDLIARLSNSLIRNKSEKLPSASNFYGVWSDTDSPDADYMIREIKDSRKFKDNMEAF